MSKKQGHQLADISVLFFDININRDSQIFAHGITNYYTPLQAKSHSFASSGVFKLIHETMAPMYIFHISVRFKVLAVMTMKIIYFVV
jgi:hypothetical protein